MPELPEVETIVRELKPRLLNQTIQSIRLRGRPTFREKTPDFLTSVKKFLICDVSRFGKGIFLHLTSTSNKNMSLVLKIHLGMTGQLLWHKKNDVVPDHTHIIFNLEKSDHELRYRDIRRFGQFALIDNAEVKNNLPPNAWLAGEDKIFDALKKKKGMIKHALMNQHVLAGLGNIYVDESLFMSKIHPQKKIEHISSLKLKSLCRAIKDVLGASLKRGGTSFKNYVDLDGNRGGFKTDLLVYGRSGERCRCGSIIKKKVVAGRGTHFCSRCQTLN